VTQFKIAKQKYSRTVLWKGSRINTCSRCHARSLTFRHIIHFVLYKMSDACSCDAWHSNGRVRKLAKLFFPWKGGLHNTIRDCCLFKKVFSLPIYLLSILASVHLTFRKHLCCLLLAKGRLWQPPAAFISCCGAMMSAVTNVSVWSRSD